MNANGIVIYKYGYWLFKKGPETSVGDKPETQIILYFDLPSHSDTAISNLSVNSIMTELSCGKNMTRAISLSNNDPPSADVHE